jgi:adenosine deaminase
MTDLPPLADLHRHLDGSLREATLRELAEAARRYLPPRLQFYAGMGLDEALSKFGHILTVLQTPDAVRRVADELCQDAAAEGVTTLEIRFAPQLHRGAELEEIVDAALEGLAGRAGLILCTLYGENPDLTERMVDCARDRPGVVGIDLAGGPNPTQHFIMEDYGKAFSRARELGIGRTVHAGEGRDPEEIAIAIESLHAQRIGHGTTLLEDPTVLQLVLERGVTIEACPTSNVHTGAIERVELHPLPQWLQRGVKACVCTDNVFLSAVTSPQEHENALKIPGMNRAKLEQVIQHGHEAAFRRSR